MQHNLIILLHFIFPPPFLQAHVSEVPLLSFLVKYVQHKGIVTPASRAIQYDLTTTMLLGLLSYRTKKRNSETPLRRFVQRAYTPSLQIINSTLVVSNLFLYLTVYFLYEAFFKVIFLLRSSVIKDSQVIYQMNLKNTIFYIIILLLRYVADSSLASGLSTHLKEPI